MSANINNLDDKTYDMLMQLPNDSLAPYLPGQRLYSTYDEAATALRELLATDDTGSTFDEDTITATLVQEHNEIDEDGNEWLNGHGYYIAEFAGDVIAEQGDYFWDLVSRNVIA